MSTPTKKELLERFNQEISRNSTWTVIYHQALASKVGLNPTDLKCAGLLLETGAITAGELGELVGLTTGAITGVIDRLEKFGLVERVKDPTDRRKVVVQVISDQARMGQVASDPAQLQEMASAFGALGQASSKLLSSRYNNKELAVILDFIETTTQLMRDQTAMLRQSQTGSARDAQL
jgi:DNA-binding MarR family transcriptional regulator